MKKIKISSFCDEIGGSMKRNILNLALLVLSLSLLLCACGNETTTETKSVETKSTETKAAATSAEHVHFFSSWETVKKATCTDTGLEERTCACGEKETKQASLTPVHSYGEWKTVTEATCTENGSQKRTCSLCGKSETKPIYTKGHTFSTWKTISEVTCTENGLKEAVCSDCGEKKTETVKSTGHRYGSWYIGRSATCTEDGYQERICSICFKEETQTIRSTGHNYSDEKCTKCGDYKTNLKITLPKTPVTIHEFRYNGSIEISCKVTSIRWEVKYVNSGGVDIDVYWSGEQTYNYQGDNTSSLCGIGYKLYDSEGYVVKSGTSWSTAVQKGEKFKDEKITMFDLDPNENYTLEFLDVK